MQSTLHDMVDMVRPRSSPKGLGLRTIANHRLHTFSQCLRHDLAPNMDLARVLPHSPIERSSMNWHAGSLVYCASVPSLQQRRLNMLLRSTKTIIPTYPEERSPTPLLLSITSRPFCRARWIRRPANRAVHMICSASPKVDILAGARQSTEEVFKVRKRQHASVAEVVRKKMG